jgi:hypothetical protein
VLLATIGYVASAQAQTVPQAPAGNAVPVTADNFNRAQTDMYFGKRVLKGVASAISRTVASCI